MDLNTTLWALGIVLGGAAFLVEAGVRHAAKATARAYAGDRAAPAPGTPDYQRIAQLERELGIGQPEPGIRPDQTVCLIKNCTGSDHEIRTWTGLLVRRIHEH